MSRRVQYAVKAGRRLQSSNCQCSPWRAAAAGAVAERLRRSVGGGSFVRLRSATAAAQAQLLPSARRPAGGGAMFTVVAGRRVDERLRSTVSEPTKSKASTARFHRRGVWNRWLRSKAKGPTSRVEGGKFERRTANRDDHGRFAAAGNGSATTVNIAEGGSAASSVMAAEENHGSSETETDHNTRVRVCGSTTAAG